MSRSSPRSTRSVTLVPDTALLRSPARGGGGGLRSARADQDPLAGEGADADGAAVDLHGGGAVRGERGDGAAGARRDHGVLEEVEQTRGDRRSTRLNSSPYCAPRTPASACTKKPKKTAKHQVL